MILNEGWGFGKTVVSLNIAMSTLDKILTIKTLIIVAPSILHNHWMSHIKTYLKEYTVIDTPYFFLQKTCDRALTEKNVLLITPCKVNELGFI